MAKKPFQIVMDHQAHAQLKYRAKELGFKLGEMVENLLASFELRLKRAYIESGVAPEQHDKFDISIANLIFAKDQGTISNEEYLQRLKKITKDLMRPSKWSPEIKFSDINK